MPLLHREAGCARAVPPRRLSRNKAKVKVAVTGKNDWNELRVRFRSIKWAPQGILYESGHRHMGKLIGEVGRMQRQTTGTPTMRKPLKARKNEGEATDADGR